MRQLQFQLQQDLKNEGAMETFLCLESNSTSYVYLLGTFFALLGMLLLMGGGEMVLGQIQRERSQVVRSRHVQWEGRFMHPPKKAISNLDSNTWPHTLSAFSSS